MHYLVTAKEMKEYDNNTIEKIGIPAMVLMERAALAVRDAISLRFAQKKVLIAVGVGNNGADGLALARLLAEEGCAVKVCMIGNVEKATEQWKHQRSILEHYPVAVMTYEEDNAQIFDNHYDVVVDAIFGVGLAREVSDSYAAFLDALNDMTGLKVAVDIPSGVSADNGAILGTAFHADLTITFGFGKLGMYLYPGAGYCGRIEVADIGIGMNAFGECEPAFFTYARNGADVNALLPNRKAEGNKGTFGKVLILAGFEQMAGAAILCARAALEIGAGMVKVICAQENRSILQSAIPEVMCGTVEDLESGLQWADVVVCGPGMGKSAQVKALLHKLLENAELPIVLDADALNMIGEHPDIKQLLCEYKYTKIMTPHVGELARLAALTIGQVKSQFIEVAKMQAKEYHSIMVCKDARTLVVRENGCNYLNITGNSGMATAGSGDVLAGIIGGLLAQTQEAYLSATLGVYLHGLAGDTASRKYTEYGVTASRIVENIRQIY